MKFNSVTLLGLAVVASAKAPSGSAPDGCSPDMGGKFEITAMTAPSKRSIERRADLLLSLAGGVLTDSQGRTGYIASNFQLQFDGPVQAGAIYDSGFSACANGSLALGSSTVFYECQSGDFYNLYDRSWAPQCKPVELVMLGSSSGGGGGGATQIPDGQVQAPTNAISQIPDGQIQVPTNPVTQIPDGQIQVPTGSPVSQIPDGQVQAPTGTPVTQIPDGQVQAPTGSPISQIPDGQVQAPTGTPVTQIPDGQVQAPTGSPISQIPDGQVQAPTGSPVSQIPDGQVQAPTGSPVTQIPDGQVQAPTGANTTMAVVPKPSTTSPQTVPGSSANKAFPAAAALIVAGLGAILCL